MSAARCLRTTLLCTTLSLSGCSITTPAASRPSRQPSPPSSPPATSHPEPVRAPTTVGPLLAIGNASGKPGSTASIDVTLNTGGASIAGTQNDLTYDPTAVFVVRRANGKPDCHVNPQLGKEGTAFSFMPPGCQGAACTGVRALVLSLSSVAPIPNGSVLYTCALHITPHARVGAQRLGATRVGFSNPTGQAIAGSGKNGMVTVGAP